MDHIAIMKPSWHLIEKIVSGQKTIESRWYQTKRTPWDKIAAGDVIYFKDSGKDITAKAEVEKVEQYEIHTIKDILPILDKYSKNICLVSTNPYTWGSTPKYCILIRLKNAEYINPFAIDKTWFGSAAAWLSIENVNKIRL